MPATTTFDYRTIDVQGRRTKGKIEAATEAAAVQQLRQQRDVPTSVSQSNSVFQAEIRIPGFSGRIKQKDLAIFARQFSTMTSSGMTLLRSLSVLEDQA